jgi:hypothetical protein
MRSLLRFKMIAYARIAGFNYYLEKMQARVIQRVVETAPGG